MKIQSLYISNGNRYTEDISRRLSVTSQARLFTNNEKLKSLFSHMKPRVRPWKEKSLELKNLITITRLDEYDSLSSLFTQFIYYDFLSSVTTHLLYLPQKTLSNCRIFNDTCPSFCGGHLNIPTCHSPTNRWSY